MVVMAQSGRLHGLGFALRRAMNDDNVEVASQKEFAAGINKLWPCDAKNLSQYMRTWTVVDKRTGEQVERPRSTPPLQFVFAVGEAWGLSDDRVADLINGWLGIQPDDQQEALIKMCKTLANQNFRPDVIQDIADVESETRSGGDDTEGEDEQSARDRGT